MGANDFQREEHYAGKWLQIFVACALAFMTFVVAMYPSPRRWIAGTPSLLLGAYLFCFFYWNRCTLTVTREGIRRALGPLPGGERLRVIPREAIVRVYIRYFEVVGKYGGRFPWQTMGVELADGGNMDLYMVSPPNQETPKLASRIAAALEWPDPVVELQGGGRRRWRWALVRPALCWLLALAFCAVWASWVSR